MVSKSLVVRGIAGAATIAAAALGLALPANAAVESEQAGTTITTAAPPEQTTSIVHTTGSNLAIWGDLNLADEATTVHVVFPPELADLQPNGLSWSLREANGQAIEGTAAATATSLDFSLPEGLPSGTRLGLSVMSDTGVRNDSIDLIVGVITGDPGRGVPVTASVVLDLDDAAISDVARQYTGDTTPAILVAGGSFDIRAPQHFWSDAAAGTHVPSTVRSSVGLFDTTGGRSIPLDYVISPTGDVLKIALPADLPSDLTAYRMQARFEDPKDQRSRTSSIVFDTAVMADHSFTADRIGGSDRYAVAAAISQRSFPQGADIAYVVTGENFPDALSAAPAAVQQRGPLLLTSRATLPAAIAAEISRLHPASIVLVGGPAAVSDAVMSELQSVAPTERIGGADRYEVSRNVLTHAFGASVRRAYIATGGNFPDALSAGAAAGSARLPVLLVDGGASSLDAATDAALRALDLRQLTIVGGPASVSSDVQTGLAAIAPTTRLGGPDRFATSRAVNVAAFPSASHSYLVTGAGFPDALVGSALAGEDDVPSFAVHPDCIPAETIAALKREGVDSVTLIGGPAALSQNVLDLAPCTAG